MFVFFYFFIFASCPELENQYLNYLKKLATTSKNSKKPNPVSYNFIIRNEERSDFKITPPNAYNKFINNLDIQIIPFGVKNIFIFSEIIINNSYIKNKKNQFLQIKESKKQKSKIKNIYLPLPDKFEDLLLKKQEKLKQHFYVKKNKILFMQFKKNDLKRIESYSTSPHGDFFQISIFIFEILRLQFKNLEKIYFIHQDDLYYHS